MFNFKRVFAINIILVSLAAVADEVSCSIVETHNMPYVKIENGIAKEGILLELYTEIAKQTKLNAKLLILPRKRVDIATQEGSLDLRCYTSPKWVSNADDYFWSKPLFGEKNIIIYQKNKITIKTTNDLVGTSLGVVLGYKYQKLESLFQENKINVIEAKAQSDLYKIIINKRADAVIMSDLVFNWINKQEKNQINKEEFGFYEIDQEQIYCALNKKSKNKFLQNDIISVINKLDIEKILNNYKN